MTINSVTKSKKYNKLYTHRKVLQLSLFLIKRVREIDHDVGDICNPSKFYTHQKNVRWCYVPYKKEQTTRMTRSQKIVMNPISYILIENFLGRLAIFFFHYFK